MPRLINTVDRLEKLALPVLVFLTAVLGAFLTYDFDKLLKNNPGWANLITFASGWIGTAFFIAAFLSFLIATIASFVRPTVKSLIEKIELVGDNFRTLCDGLMANVAAKLAIRPGDNTRVSLYIHDTDSCFVLCGRYAPNPVYRAPGRPSYPDDQGCIAIAWRDGWCFENNLVNRSTAYEKNTQQRYNIDPATLHTISMRSKLFGVQRIDISGDSIALIVVESLREDRFDEPSLQAELEKFAEDYSAIIMSFKNPFIPLTHVEQSGIQ